MVHLHLSVCHLFPGPCRLRKKENIFTVSQAGLQWGSWGCGHRPGPLQTQTHVYILPYQATASTHKPPSKQGKVNTDSQVNQLTPETGRGSGSGRTLSLVPNTPVPHKAPTQAPQQSWASCLQLRLHPPTYGREGDPSGTQKPVCSWEGAGRS